MGTWTPDHLIERLSETFRDMEIAIYSPRINQFETTAFRPSQYGDERSRGLELLTLTAAYLGRESDLRKALLARAQAQAGKGSASSTCRHYDWSRSTYEERWRRGAQVVCDGLNRDASEKHS